MAREIALQDTGLSGSTLYATLDRGGRRWNLALGVLEDVRADHWPDYVVTLVEAIGTGYFIGDLPTGLTPPVPPVEVAIYERTGDTPATSDPVVGGGTIDGRLAYRDAAVGAVPATLEAAHGAGPWTRPDLSGLSTFDPASDPVVVGTLPSPAPAGYGAEADIHTQALRLGNVRVQPDGSWLYYDAIDPTVPRVRVIPIPRPGGRDVVLDPT
jgi:hypothetical protein